MDGGIRVSSATESVGAKRRRASAAICAFEGRLDSQVTRCGGAQYANLAKRRCNCQSTQSMLCQSARWLLLSWIAAF